MGENEETKKEQDKKMYLPVHNTNLVYELALALSRAHSGPGPPFFLALQSLG
jgi:hypothetical protein